MKWPFYVDVGLAGRYAQRKRENSNSLLEAEGRNKETAVQLKIEIEGPLGKYLNNK
jgi:hypothetical protein